MKLVLLGDSIRMGVQPVVTERLTGHWEVAGPGENCGDSSRHVERLDAWLAETGVGDVIQINCGLHDIKRATPDAECQVPLEDYKSNLQQVLEKLRLLAPTARLIWATTTPVIEHWHNERKGFCRFNADLDAANSAASHIARDAGLEILDLHAAINRIGREKALGADGVHMTDLGNAALADAIVARITQQP